MSDAQGSGILAQVDEFVRGASRVDPGPFAPDGSALPVLTDLVSGPTQLPGVAPPPLPDTSTLVAEVTVQVEARLRECLDQHWQTLAAQTRVAVADELTRALTRALTAHQPSAKP